MINCPIDPTDLTMGNHDVPRFDGNGERFILMDSIPGTHIIKADFMCETCPDVTVVGKQALHNNVLIAK
jgi:hypothetical protein